jgi:hypothetical protein
MTAAIDVLDLRTFPPVTPLVPVPDHFRQTLLSKSTECLRSAYLYTKYDGGALTHPLAGGTVLHRAIEMYIRILLENDEMYGNGETAKDVLNQALAEATDLTVGPDRFDSMRAMMFHLAEGLAINPREVVCLETPVEVELGGRRITGTIDFAEADDYEVRIRDWKSAFYNVSRPHEDPDHPEYVPTKDEWPGTFQLILYAYALATGSIHGAPEGFNFNNVGQFRLREDHPREFWKREGTMAYREAVIDRETLLDWQLYLEASVEKLAKAFETWQFPAVWGKHCDYCPASAECPIPAPLRKFRGEIRTDDDAVRAMVRRERHDQISTEIWESVKAFMKRRGGRLRYGRDLELYFKKQESERLKRKVEVAGGKKIDGRVALQSHIQRRNEGQPGEIDWTHYYEKSVSTRLTRRKLTDAEVNDEKRNGTIS